MADVMVPRSGGAEEQGRRLSPLLVLLGILSLVPYLYAFQLQDLRARTVEFEIAFFAAFALYAVAVILVVRQDALQHLRRTQVQVFASRRSQLAVLFAFAMLFRAILSFTPPTLSDDMYRYVWDGRVQAHGISPYAYAPNAEPLRELRDPTIWRLINRKDAVTVYPAGAQLAYAALWRVVPDQVRWYQFAMSAGDLLVGLLLVLLLRAFDRSPNLALIYLWSPLAIFETAHAAHVDGLVLPLVVAAWLARVKDRDGWTGAFLGAAAALKLYPLLLFPALWRARDDRGRWRAAWAMPCAFVSIFALAYTPYLLQGASVLGYLPKYLDENFNLGFAGIVFLLVGLLDGTPAQASQLANGLLAVTLAVISMALILHPAKNSADAIRRCIYPMGAFVLLTQNLFPWYLLWLVPLLAIFLKPGKLGLRIDAWTGWFLFSGLIALAYTFFISWTPQAWASWLEFVPLYALLLLALAREAEKHLRSKAAGEWRGVISNGA